MHLGHTLGSTGLFGYQVWLQRRHFSVGNSSFLFMTLIYTVRYIMSRGRLVQTKKTAIPPPQYPTSCGPDQRQGRKWRSQQQRLPLDAQGSGLRYKGPPQGGIVVLARRERPPPRGRTQGDRTLPLSNARAGSGARALSSSFSLP